MALWGGRFEDGADAFTQGFGASLPVDRRMYDQDIRGSIAHARMLAKAGVLTDEEASDVETGLLGIRRDIEEGAFAFDVSDEDIHMAIEAELTRRIGDAGRRLHTGRSRNDQVAVDTHLYVKEALNELLRANLALRKVLLEAASGNVDAIMPGYTHMQHAQPVLFSHHMMAYVNMFQRDFRRLQNAREAADVNPLGAAALAGTSYGLDRAMTTEELGFKDMYSNSLDAVSDRDYLLDTVYACGVSALHLSRLCEEIILWSSSEFGFIVLSDSYSTGSSIMPQKKNPDFAELIRGKSGRVVGDLVSLMVVLKSLPLAYNKDLQEDKEAAFDAMDTLHDCYICASGMVSTMEIRKEAMLDATSEGFMEATDVADYLVGKGVPFRKAHEIVGHLVLMCEKRGCGLPDLETSDFKQTSDAFGDDIKSVMDMRSIVDARNTYGGTSSEQVAQQLKKALERIGSDEALLV